MKKNKEQLINNIVGQLEGIKRMIGEKEDCFKIMIQMKAVKSAFDNVMENFLKNNFLDCSAKMKKSDREKMEKLLKELLKK
ncbi:MAG: metal-sensitive transcriptional regulator [Candidatus Moranbacteria bacterium]|jgi:DNA-binding FrmR family transcriptional regulator|nr:metal-sensitive transcriptional regulator [Candidatus Moranbacteria bacterium]